MSGTHAQSREELLRYLEQLSGRSIRTRADVRSCVDELLARRDDRAARRWQRAKMITLVALASFAFLQYYVLDIFVRIASLAHLTVFVG